jgi:hypothetical protein
MGDALSAPLCRPCGPSLFHVSALSRGCRYRMMWHLSWRADPFARRIADGHYSRQKPGTPQFVPTGSCMVLSALTDTGRAYWVTSWPLAEWVKHEWGGAWICSAFRSEGAGKASEMIRQAVAATRAFYGEPPDRGMVTFVNPKKVRPAAACLRRGFIGPIPIYGQVFRQAGFREVGRTKDKGLIALQLLPKDMPDPEPPLGFQLGLVA